MAKRSPRPVPPRRACLVAEPRSGSNLLASLLDSHPAIAFHFELFNPDAVYLAARLRPALEARHGGELAPARRDRRPHGWLKRVLKTTEAADPAARVVGFKLFAGQCDPVLRHQCRAPEIAVIRLTRRNRLAQYASLKSALASQRWTDRDGPAIEEKVHFEREDFLRYTTVLDAQARQVDAWLGLKRRCLVTYEDLTESPERREATLARILEHLGLEVTPLTSGLSRQDSRPTLERFDNPGDAIAALKELRAPAPGDRSPPKAYGLP